METVRCSAAAVAARSTLVRIDPPGLYAFAGSLRLEDILTVDHWEAPHHPRLPAAGSDHAGLDEDLINYLFCNAALNFGSGFSPLWKSRRSGTTYTAMAAALTRLHESGQRLDAGFAAAATPAQVAGWLEIEEDFPLVRMYAASLSELGTWVVDRYGSYAQLLQRLPQGNAASALIELLTANLSCFNDRARYGDIDVCFFKRAQILVYDLHRALGAEASPFCSAEIARLTCFADNLVPHVLRKEGALTYNGALLDRIARRDPLAAGSAEEVEIRAAAVTGVEQLTALLRQRWGEAVYPALLDLYLWTRGQEARYKAEPRHLTVSYYY